MLFTSWDWVHLETGQTLFENSFLESHDVPDSNIFKWSNFLLDFNHPSDSIFNFSSWNWLLHFEAGSRNQSSISELWWIQDTQRSDVKVWRRHQQWTSVTLLIFQLAWYLLPWPWSILSFFSPYWNFEDEIFVRWVEYNIPS